MKANKEKNSFVFYLTWCTLLLQMPDKMRHSTMDAILQYVATGTEPDDVETKFGFFSLVKQQLDKDNEKWERIRLLRSKAGKHGNDVRWVTPSESQNIANATKVAVDGNDNVNVNANKETAKAAKKCVSLNIENRKEDFKESIMPYKEQYDSKLLNDFFEYWTEPNKSGTKMRFELQKTWDVSRRLSRWANNSINR